MISDLPVGSTFDGTKGVFYWQPGPGFQGNHTIEFLLTDREGNTKRRIISIRIFTK
jgi:hypothetical protein